MSGYDAGSLFVKIVPDASGFGTDAAREIKAQAPAVQQAATQTTASRGASSEVAKLQAQARELTGSFAQAAKTADAQLFGGLQARSAALSEELARLTAQGGNVVAHLSGDFNAMFAAEAKAAAATQQVNAALAETVVLEEKVGRSERARGQAQAQTARSQLRNVLTGQASLSSLGPAALGRFALGGLAVGAVFQGLQHLSDGLRVTGDEASTTEGKLRNFGASLVTGDVVGGLLALTVHAKSASEQLADLQKQEGSTSATFRNFAADTRQQAAAQQELADSLLKPTEGMQHLSHFGAQAGETARETAKGLDVAAAAADHLADSLDTRTTPAMQAVRDAIAAAGSEAAAFGEAGRSAGNGIAGSSGGRTDSTATADNAQAIADARVQRTKTLTDDLALAQKRERDAEAKQARFRAAGDVEGAQARQREVEEARTTVAQIEQQIDAQESQAAKAAAANRERAAREAEQARAEAARVYTQGVANQLKRLEIAADAAGNVGKAEQKYLTALQRESHDAKLTTEAQLGYAAALTNEKQNQTQAIQAAAQADQERKLALDDLRIQQADLTDGTADNERAINNKIKHLKALRAKTKQYSDEWIQYSSEITGLQIQVKNLKDGGGSDFSLQDLFQTASDQFATFGSNIAGRNGVLSGQDERAAFGKSITDSVAARSLAQQEQQTAILRSLLQEMRGGSRGGSPAVAGKGKTGNLQAIYGAEIAAAYGYGVN